MVTETLYSDGNTGSGVTVTNGANANGVQDGSFASANTGWAKNDNWEFTMDDTSLTALLLAAATSMVCNLRYYFSGAFLLTTVFNFDVYDGNSWTTLETFNIGNAPQDADPGDYIENYDLLSILDTVAKLNAAKFRFIETDATGSGHTIYVDSIRIVTTRTVAGKTHQYGPTFFLTSQLLPAYRRNPIRRKVTGTALEILSAKLILPLELSS